jgi:hypothetical protein
MVDLDGGFRWWIFIQIEIHNEYGRLAIFHCAPPHNCSVFNKEPANLLCHTLTTNLPPHHHQSSKYSRLRAVIGVLAIKVIAPPLQLLHFLHGQRLRRGQIVLAAGKCPRASTRAF